MDNQTTSPAAFDSKEYQRSGKDDPRGSEAGVEHHTYSQLISLFGNCRVLVLGDFIMDVYLKGHSTRLTPEAPVPVVDVVDRTICLGGSANAVSNLRALNAQVKYYTVVGQDKEGDEGLSILNSIGADTQGVLRSTTRKTISKTRVVAGSHVITRFDAGSCGPISSAEADQLLATIEGCIDDCDALIISDYDKGIVTPALLTGLKRILSNRGKFVAVDSKRLSFFAGLHPSFVKPNYEEALQLLGLEIDPQDRAEQIQAAGTTLYEKLNAETIAVTLDAEGSLLLQNGKPVHRCFAPPVTTPYVSGAGDTYLSTYVLSQAAGAAPDISADIATAAASIAVRKESTATCSVRELQAYYQTNEKYIDSQQHLKELCDEYHRLGKRVVFTNGCFDILHSGHVTYLHCVKKMGDVLIVGINNDDSIKRLKGAERPINSLSDRLQVLSGLSSVDHVIGFGDIDDDTPSPLIELVRPHIFAKGGDYTRDKLPEAAVVESLGGEIVFVPYVANQSTTGIIKRITRISKPGETIKTAASR